MNRTTDEELDELFAGKTREECLEIALRQMLGIFDSSLTRRLCQGPVFREAIDVARRVIPYDLAKP